MTFFLFVYLFYAGSGLHPASGGSPAGDLGYNTRSAWVGVQQSCGLGRVLCGDLCVVVEKTTAAAL